MPLDVPLGALLCAVAAWLISGAASRLAPRLLPAPGASGEGLLRTMLVAAMMTVSPVAVLGFTGGLSAAALIIVAASIYVACRWPPAPAPVRAEGGRSYPSAVRWPLILTLVLVGFDLIAYLPASPVDWDAATYHLFLPARWLQEGRIFHLPTVFGDNAAAFAPQNGALYFAWQMALSGRDALANVSQLPCLAFLGLALYRTCRLLGTSSGPAALAALTLPWLAPVRRFTYSANVDVMMVAFAFGALYWMLLYRRRPDRATIAACGLASGLAAGTKTLGLPLVALQAVPLVWLAVRRRRFADLALFFGCALAAGGWWYLLNFWRYGNPLFPVKVSLGLFELPGAYRPDAIRAGEFHLEGTREVAAAVLGQYGAATCLLVLLGLSALAWRSLGVFRAAPEAGERNRGGVAAVLLLQALAWAAFFAAIVPHNDQARFLMPTLVAGLAGWALLLDRASELSPTAANLAWLGGISAAVAASRPWQGWAASIATLLRAEVDAGRWIVTAALCAAAVAGTYCLRRRLGRVWVIAGWVLAATAVAIGSLHADAARPAFLATADYRAWAEGYLPFNDAELPPARIAYTGANLPYALAGAGWRHRVVYVDTQGEQGDGFYQHWRRRRREYAYHKPGLYRGHDDVELWLRRLEQLDVDTVVIFRLHRAERRYIRSTPEGFPIEQAWVRRRPERFEPVFTGRAAEIYRLLPEASF